MSEKRIDLLHSSFSKTVYVTEDTMKEYDILVCCEDSTMSHFPDFVSKCTSLGIKPICGVKFELETPMECLTEYIRICCYPRNEDGCRNLQILCAYADFGKIKYDVFRKFSENLIIGLDIVYGEVEMLIIDNILQSVLMPDFVLIASTQNTFRSWQGCYEMLEAAGIPVCGCNFSMNRRVPDADILKRFAFLGNKAQECVIDNPRKIAERITEDYKFAVQAV